MSDDPEQSLQVEAAPGLSRRVLAAQTPPLSRFLSVGEHFPAVTLGTSGGTRGAPPTPLLLRFRVEEGGDPDAMGVEEGTAGSGDQAPEP